jgi:DNA-binding MarR family transcriptional regulator
MAKASTTPESRDDDEDVRWLTAEERRAWFALASLVSRLDSALDTQLRRDSGINHFDYVVLATLSDAPDRTMRMSDLASLSSGSLPRLSQVAARLEKRGWLRRTPDPTNGRYTLAVLTEAGQSVVISAAPGHVREVRRLVFDPLTKTQVQQLATIGQRIARTIDPADHWLARSTEAPQPTGE